jgi:hypothetical protein
MTLQDLPKWTHVVPILLGVALSIIGMSVFPMLGMRNTLGPILGLPLGSLLGFGLLALFARTRSV